MLARQLEAATITAVEGRAGDGRTMTGLDRATKRAEEENMAGVGGMQPQEPSKEKLLCECTAGGGERGEERKRITMLLRALYRLFWMLNVGC